MNKFLNKLELKKRANIIVDHTFSAKEYFIYSISPNIKKEIVKNKYHKDIHKGKCCFILGTGPSLSKINATHINKLKNEVLFCVNSFYKSTIGSQLTPNYYVLIDPLYWTDWSFTFKEIVNKYSHQQPIFIADFLAKKMLDDLNITKKENRILTYSRKKWVDRVDENLDTLLYDLMNVVSHAIISAIYMGFKEIYLLGCDYSAFCNHGRGHCYDDSQELSDTNYNLSFYLKLYHLTTEAHYLIAKLAKEKGVEIINLTEGSLLDAYPRKPVSSIL